MTIKLGITGGIGSGKSVVSHLMETMGVPVYNSDAEAKRLTVESPSIRKQLIALLGEEVYANNQLNKPLLASYLFGHPDHVRRVNSIIHPEVKKDFRKWVEARRISCDVVGMESAILIESGFADEVDVLVMVYAPLETRIQRTMERDKVGRKEVEQRIRHQMDDEEKREKTHYVIINNGETPLLPQVEKLLLKIRTTIATKELGK